VGAKLKKKERGALVEKKNGGRQKIGENGVERGVFGKGEGRGYPYRTKILMPPGPSNAPQTPRRGDRAR